MQISLTEPDIPDHAWLNTTEAVEAMGMKRTTFWRKASCGLIKRRWRPMENAFRYRGKDLKRAWRLLK